MFRRRRRSAAQGRGRPPAARVGRPPARGKRPPTAPASPPPPASPPGPATAILWGALAALALARAVLAFVPSMWAWSLNLQRFVEPVLGWALWGAACLALMPPVARRAAPALAWAGEAFHKAPFLAALAWGTGGAALVALTPDRVRFVGDFLLRQGTVEVAEQPSVLFPQAFPLDVLLHYHLPRLVADTGLLDPNGAARALGMLEAGLLAMLATGFARALELRGAAAFASASIVFFGGYLGMFTGFSKAFAEMSLMVAMVGVFGLRAMREGRGVLPLGVAVGIGIALHRSALGLLPAAVLALVWWGLTHGRGGAWKRPQALAGLAIPVVTLAVMIPRIVAVVRQWDAVHFVPRAVEEHGGVLGAALAGSRPVDLVNLLVMLSPLAPAALLAAPALWKPGRAGAGAGREIAFLAALAAPFVGVMPFIHPVQGLFRDWDDFAATGVAVSMVAAWVVGRALAGAPRRAWLAVAATLAVGTATLQWLVHHTDIDRGFARIRALMLEPPPRAAPERGSTWDFLGIRNFRLDRWDAAAESFRQAAETSPSPRILQQWALVETMRGRLGDAQGLYHRMLEKAPDNALGWLGLATVSIRAGDLAEGRRACHELLRLQPGNLDARRLLADIARLEEAARGRP